MQAMWNGFGQRSHDDLDPVLVRGVEYAIDVAEVENPGFGSGYPM